jgi:hypothetical protein
VQSKAKTVKDYLAELPADRREAIQAVRQVILNNLDKGYEEGMQYGAISYFVPHRLYPAGYHCDPKIALPFGGLGSQKHYMSVGFMCHYNDAGEMKWFQSAWARTGKKLDMGKCCIRFKKAEDLALDVIAEALRRMPAERFIEQYEAARSGTRTPAGVPIRKSPKKAAAKKSPTKKVFAKTSGAAKGRSKKSPKKRSARSSR